MEGAWVPGSSLRGKPLNQKYTLQIFIVLGHYDFEDYLLHYNVALYWDPIIYFSFYHLPLSQIMHLFITYLLLQWERKPWICILLYL